MAQTNKYHATIGAEGANEILRGKIPSPLIQQMGGNKGDMIEFEVTGKMITGGRVIRGRDADRIRANRAAAPVGKQNTSKTVKKVAPAKKAQPKVTAKVAKAPVRKTSVAYDTKKVVKKAGSPVKKIVIKGRK
jgi:hypothetical protein